jgi:hypothetical protein
MRKETGHTVGTFPENSRHLSLSLTVGTFPEITIEQW